MTKPRILKGTPGSILFGLGTLLGTLLLVPLPAQAWMFCWNSQATGIENCWGYPPNWYLHGGGPRTIVWLDGHLLDDTSWPAQRHAEAKQNVLSLLAMQTDQRRENAAQQNAAVKDAQQVDTQTRIDSLKERSLCYLKARTPEAEAACFNQ